MILDRITITGADDGVDPQELVKRTEDFPLVEWGILVSRDRHGVEKYPSATWIQRLQRIAPPEMKLSLHICGAWTRHLLHGANGVPSWLFDKFQRVQLNFRSKYTTCYVKDFYQALSEIPNKQFIFQLDDNAANEHYSSLMWLCSDMVNKIDQVPLFDISGGRGITPEKWPEPPRYGLCGYAGGLGPDNLVQQLSNISECVGDRRIWIDMESKIRSIFWTKEHTRFDLDKVDTCLNIAHGFASTKTL